jgi:hypothetical protein
MSLENKKNNWFDWSKDILPSVVISGLASSGEGATLSIKPIIRPLPIFFLADITTQGKTCGESYSFSRPHFIFIRVPLSSFP